MPIAETYQYRSTLVQNSIRYAGNYSKDLRHTYIFDNISSGGEEMSFPSDEIEMSK